MKQRINIGIIQMISLVGNVEFNTEKAAALIEKAAKEGAHFVVLPELFATGYNMEVLGRDIMDLSERYYGYIYDKMSEAAKWNKVHVVAPFGSKREEMGPVYNAVQIFDDEGKEIGRYEKTHLWDLEHLYFAEGTEYPVFETKFGKIGILVCYDMEFPEAARELRLKGAEIIFAPAAWTSEFEHDWDMQYMKRALENGLFVVGVNKAGNEGGMRFLGKGKIHDHLGNTLLQLPVLEEEVAVGTVKIPLRVPAAGVPLEMEFPAASGGEAFRRPKQEGTMHERVLEADSV
ncbi:MAG: nitrilase-related carbon-nitrogen hydrolase [Thermovirgaceae bacterium]